MSGKDKKVLIILGPTAVGKTSLATKLAERIEAELISADSCQIYKFMNIGTDKPPHDPENKHHLVDFLAPDKRFDAMQFVNKSEEAIRDILARSLLPIVVGGTGLYIKALVDGLFTGIFKDRKVRAELEKRRLEEDEDLYALLEKVDPKAAAQIHPNNYVRIQRALEVYLLSGKPISYWWSQGKYTNSPFEYIQIGLTRARKKLYKRAE